MGNLLELPLGIYEKAISNHLTWQEKLELVKESGFDFLEMSIDGTPERLERLYQSECILQIKSAVEKTKCPIYTLALTANRNFPLGSQDEEICKKGKEVVCRAIDFALKIGIRVIHLAAYDELNERRSAETEQNFLASLKECLSYAASHGVILALETMDTDFMDSGYKIMKLIRLFDTPYLQCYTDIGNLSAAGVDVQNDVVYTGSHIVGIHLKDTKSNIYRDIKFGEGCVDFAHCFEVLENIDYQGFLVAETWSYDKESFHPYLKEIYGFLRDRMKHGIKRRNS